jgi:hypothetical protein
MIQAIRKFEQDHPPGKAAAAAAAGPGSRDDPHISLLVAASELRKPVGMLEDVYLQDVLAEVQGWRTRVIQAMPSVNVSSPNGSGTDSAALSPAAASTARLRAMLQESVEQCCREYDIFRAIFADAAAVNVVDVIVQLFFQRMVDEFRPVIVRETSVEVLCNMIRIFKDEFLGTVIPRRVPSALPMEPVIKQLMQDAQERLLFRVTLFIKNEVRGFTPGSKDANYPDVLVHAEQQGLAEDLLYPPVAWSIALLRQVHTCLDLAVFHNASHEAVEACAYCVTFASTKISAPDSHLFVLRNLFRLRSELEKLNVGTIFTDKNLDLSEMYAHFGDLLTGRRSLLVFLQRGLRVTESQSDSKRDIEKECRKAVEALVMEWTRNLLDPLLAHIAKATALQRARKTSTVEENTYLSQSEIQPLMSHVLKHMSEQLHMIFKKLRLYLPSGLESSRYLVLPMRQNAVEAFSSLSKLLESHQVTAETRLSWGIPSTQSVESMFQSSQLQQQHLAQGVSPPSSSSSSSSPSSGQQSSAPQPTESALSPSA